MTMTETKAPRKSYPFSRKFTEWFQVRSQGETLSARQELLRDDMKLALQELGKPDDNGHLWITLRQPVELEGAPDKKGHVKRFVFTALKLQRSLKPAHPVPMDEPTEELLKKKGLWLSDVQEEQLRQLAVACPNVVISVAPDIDAVTALYLKKVITKKEYDALLPEQEEQWSFIPCEDV